LAYRRLAVRVRDSTRGEYEEQIRGYMVALVGALIESRRPVVFIAMNLFHIAEGSEAAFEQVWLSRDSHLDKVLGFVEFHLLNEPLLPAQFRCV
jgi:hypothetical protein